MKDWEIKRTAGDQALTYKFSESYSLKPNSKVKVF